MQQLAHGVAWPRNSTAVDRGSTEARLHAPHEVNIEEFTHQSRVTRSPFS